MKFIIILLSFSTSAQVTPEVIGEAFSIRGLLWCLLGLVSVYIYFKNSREN